MSVQWTPIRLAMEAEERKEGPPLVKIREKSSGDLSRSSESVVVGWSQIARKTAASAPSHNTTSLFQDWRRDGSLSSSTPEAPSRNLKSTFTTVAVMENIKQQQQVMCEPLRGFAKPKRANGDYCWKRNVGLQCDLIKEQPTHVLLPPEPVKKADQAADKGGDDLVVLQSSDAVDAAPSAGAVRSKKDDAVPKPTETAKRNSEGNQNEDESCFVDCLFYSMQCCDCTII